MNNKPLISFCLPTYNRLEWLAESVMSILSQSYDNYEVIIIDDGSTDGSWEFLNEWLGDNKKVRLYRNDHNMGAGPSRHKACELAQGEIVLVCDSDDINVVERGEETVKWFAENPESELVTFPYVSVGYNNEVLKSYEGEPFDHETYKQTGRVNYYCNPSVGFKRKSYFETEGYKKENSKETDDSQFVRNWIKAGKKIDFKAGDALLLHRVLPDSMMVGLRGFDPAWVGA